MKHSYLDEPELRFPEFNDNWEIVKLNNIISLMQSGLSRELSDEDIGVPVLRSNNIVNGHIDISDIRYWYLKDTKGAKVENYFLKDGDLLINFINSLSQIGKNAIYNNELNRPTIFTTNIMRLNFKENINSNFIFHLFNTSYYKNYIDKITKPAVNQASFTTADLKKMELKIPNRAEQEKIARFLSLIDKKIELLEKNLNAYQKYYDYVSNNYFDNITCDNIVKFKDIISKGKAGGTPKASNKSYYDGEIPFLSINDMTTQGKYINYTTKMISEDGLNNSSAWIIPKNSLLYSIYASIGFVSINKIDLTTSQAIYGIILKENINQDFIYHYLKNFKRHIYKYIETGTQGNLNSKIVNDIPIKLPSDVEQKTYADFFNKFDKIIEIKLNEIAKFKDFKRGLLQKMFV